MFTVAQALESFISSLELKDDERKRVIAQHEEMRNHLRQKLGPKTDFLSGSYSRNTAIRPLHDVDIFVVLPQPWETPNAVLLKVRRALHDAYPNKELPMLQSHSVHVEFSDNEFDVVPGYEHASGGYWIPERDTGQWIHTDPKQHQDISTKANEDAEKKLKPLLKAVKHWNGRQQSSPLRSFHLEVMSYKAFSAPPLTYAMGLATLFDSLSQQVMTKCPDPAGLGPEVDKGMQPGQRESAQQLLSSAGKDVRKAISLQSIDLASSHAIFRKLFGREYPEQ